MSDPTALMAWESVALDGHGGGLPQIIRSSWVFILRAAQHRARRGTRTATSASWPTGEQAISRSKSTAAGDPASSRAGRAARSGPVGLHPLRDLAPGRGPRRGLGRLVPHGSRGRARRGAARPGLPGLDPSANVPGIPRLSVRRKDNCARREMPPVRSWVVLVEDPTRHPAASRSLPSHSQTALGERAGRNRETSRSRVALGFSRHSGQNRWRPL